MQAQKEFQAFQELSGTNIDIQTKSNYLGRFLNYYLRTKS
jgi:hypothetical protein